jgi:methionine-rich copper-binding protein CopC
MNRSIVVSAFLAASVVLSSEALAHAHLVQTVPAANAIVQRAPSELELRFSEAIEAKFTKIEVKGPDGGDVPIKTITAASEDKTMLIVIPAIPLPAGTYQVFWRAVSVDTHASEGNYSFTIQP